MRFRVEPGDVPAEVAARRLGLSLAQFTEVLPRLLGRGVPPPDPDTGNYDLEAIDAWRRLRNPRLFNLTTMPLAHDARAVGPERLARMRGG